MIKKILNQCLFFILVLFVSIIIIVTISYYFSKDDYYFINKNENEQIYRIKTLNIVLEFPISENSFNKIKNFDDYDIKKDLIYAWDFDLIKEQNKPRFYSQVEKIFLNNNLIRPYNN